MSDPTATDLVLNTLLRLARTSSAPLQNNLWPITDGMSSGVKSLRNSIILVRCGWLLTVFAFVISI